VSHPTTKVDLDAFVAATKASITLFSTTPKSVPENKLSFSFDHACICKILAKIAFETASSLLIELPIQMSKHFTRGMMQHHLFAVLYNCVISSLQSSFASFTSSDFLLKDEAANPPIALVASVESPSAALLDRTDLVHKFVGERAWSL
jgi:hypothetical protein